jgi:hypothetical protein
MLWRADLVEDGTVVKREWQPLVARVLDLCKRVKWRGKAKPGEDLREEDSVYGFMVAVYGADAAQRADFTDKCDTVRSVNWCDGCAGAGSASARCIMVLCARHAVGRA